MQFIKKENFIALGAVAGGFTVRKYLISIGLLAVIIVVLLVKLMLPSYQRYQSLTKEYNKKTVMKEKMDNKLNEIKTTDYQEITTITDRILAGVPSSNNYLPVFNGIKYLAEKNRINILGFQINPGAVENTAEDGNKKKDREQIVVDLELSGSLYAIREMVNGIEKGLPVSEVTELAFSDKRIATGSATAQNIDAKMEIVSYWQRLPAYLAKYEEPIARLGEADYQIVEKIKDFQSYLVSPYSGTAPSEAVLVGRDNPFPF